MEMWHYHEKCGTKTSGILKKEKQTNYEMGKYKSLQKKKIIIQKSKMYVGDGN